MILDLTIFEIFAIVTYTFGTSSNLMVSRLGSSAKVACATGCTASKSHANSTPGGGALTKLRRS